MTQQVYLYSEGAEKRRKKKKVGKLPMSKAKSRQGLKKLHEYEEASDKRMLKRT